MTLWAWWLAWLVFSAGMFLFVYGWIVFQCAYAPDGTIKTACQGIVIIVVGTGGLYLGHLMGAMK